jgi:hypothetical protein
LTVKIFFAHNNKFRFTKKYGLGTERIIGKRKKVNSIGQ